MTLLTNFCHNYHLTPSSNKRRTLSTIARGICIGIIIVVIIHSFISQRGIDVKATEANLFQSFFFFNLIFFRF